MVPKSQMILIGKRQKDIFYNPFVFSAEAMKNQTRFG